MDCVLTSTGSTPKPRRPDGWLRSRYGAPVAALLGVVAMAAAAAGTELLPPEQAFRFSARALDARTLEARFAIADGYYLYRDKFKFAVTPDGAVLGAPELPAGKIKTDEFFGKVETYRGTVVVKLPLSGAAAGQTVVLAADSQGCADVGVCYPPTRQKLTLALPAPGAGPGAVVDATPPKKSWFK
jgi:thiol:disulfide interchange protein DsbD